MCSPYRLPTINLAKITLNKLKAQGCNLEKVPSAKPKLKICHPPFKPSPIRPLKHKSIEICKPSPVEFVYPPIPCICPPCQICPSFAEVMGRYFRFACKGYFLYFCFYATYKNGIWGNADFAAMTSADISNFINFLIGADKHTFGGESPRIGFLEIERLKYRLIKLWDKSVSLLFYATIGIPLNYANEIFLNINNILFPCDNFIETDEDYQDDGKCIPEKNKCRSIKPVNS